MEPLWPMAWLASGTRRAACWCLRRNRNTRSRRRTLVPATPSGPSLIVVMVDELAGDGAGTPFVRAVAQWLSQEFIDPFEGRGSPFRVVLIASDASLSNEVVLERYLEAGERAPDKILVSRSVGERCF